MEALTPIVPILVGVLAVALAVSAVGHVVLTKRNVRSAIGWVGFVLVFPLLGPVLYLSFGINRVRERARRRRSGRCGTPAGCRASLADHVPDSARRPAMPRAKLAKLAYLGGRVVDRPLIGGNSVEVLEGGDAAYPAMLAAIEAAERTVFLETYIFDVDRSGSEFVEALDRAARRGVDVRVLVDSVGARYSRISSVRELRRRGVPAAEFMRTRLPIFQPHVNLRTHRKILVVDGAIGFVGGMNIREGHRTERAERHRVQDVHFRLRGPIVSLVQQVGLGDWRYTTGELAPPDLWFPDVSPDGDVLARVVPDGPDEDLDKVRWTILGALAEAESRVQIVTPYFLPDEDLITAINVASLRGIDVTIVLPEENNLPFVHWAAMGQLSQTMEHGARVVLTPPPFDHTKLLLVDATWALVGSSNLDPRSLRLNFELNVELYDEAVGVALHRIVDSRIRSGRVLALDELESRSLPIKLRDGLARLAQPYL